MFCTFSEIKRFSFQLCLSFDIIQQSFCVDESSTEIEVPSVMATVQVREV